MHWKGKVNRADAKALVERKRGKITMGPPTATHWCHSVTVTPMALNLAVLRHMALNILNTEKSKISNQRKIKRAGWNNAFLTNLLAQI